MNEKGHWEVVGPNPSEGFVQANVIRNKEEPIE